MVECKYRTMSRFPHWGQDTGRETASIPGSVLESHPQSPGSRIHGAGVILLEVGERGLDQVDHLSALKLSLSPTWVLSTKKMKERAGTLCAQVTVLPPLIAFCQPPVQSLSRKPEMILQTT